MAWWVPVLLGASAIGKAISGRQAEVERGRRYGRLQDELRVKRQRAISEGTTRISQMTKGQIARSRAATARRLQALGFAKEAESFIAPSEAMIAGEGNRALKDYLFDVNRFYDTAEMNAAAQFAGRPIEAGVLDYAAEAVPLAVDYFQNEEFLNAYKNAGSAPNSDTETPDLSMKEDITQPQNNADRVGDQSWAFNFSRRTMDPFSGKDLTRFSRGGLTFGDLAKRSRGLTFGALR